MPDPHDAGPHLAAARRIGGRHALATLYDASADIMVTPRMSVTGYYGFAAGGAAAAISYPTSNHARLGYAELLVRF